MDLMTTLIGFLLLFTGAVFFGYPIGLIVGRNGWGEPFEPAPSKKRVSHSEHIEEVKNADVYH